jgi:hypothetical protein
MAITERLVALGQGAKRLNDGSDRLNRLISEIDKALARLNIGMDYTHPRPLTERSSTDDAGKRTIELGYLGYLPIRGRYHLVIKTVKIMEDKAAMATQAPVEITPLLTAPRALRHAAGDVLPDLVDAISSEIHELVDQVERRCETAQNLLEELRILEATSSGTAGRVNEISSEVVSGELGEDGE